MNRDNTKLEEQPIKPITLVYEELVDELTNIIKNSNHCCARPNARHPIAPIKIVVIKRGFLYPFVSENVPNTGPIMATNNVAIDAAYRQYAIYSTSDNPAFPAR